MVYAKHGTANLKGKMFTWSKQPCGHLNGWQESIRVGLFRKHYFVCTDCRQLINLDERVKK
jgi:hypothetical protein